MKKPKKLVLASALSVLLSGAVYAALPVEGPAETWTIAQIELLAATISARIAAFAAAFNSQMILKFENIISAVAVATKQEALSANVVMDAMKNASERLVAAQKALSVNRQVAETTINYHPSMGQGFDPCGTAFRNKTLDLAFDKIDDKAAEAVAWTDVAPGRFVQRTGEALNFRLVQHRMFYCTQAEADADLCDLPADASLQGADTNAALFFEPADFNSPKAIARRFYMQHVLGPPSEAAEFYAKGTPAGQNYYFLKNRQDAMLSVPANSLAMIDAANTRDPSMGNRSPNEILTLRVNQYFGGAEAEQWSGALARQSQRGLLVEANKMAGLGAWMRFKQYEQNQRIEANLATLVVAAAERLDGPIEREYQRALSDGAAGEIK